MRELVNMERHLVKLPQAVCEFGGGGGGGCACELFMLMLRLRFVFHPSILLDAFNEKSGSQFYCEII